MKLALKIDVDTYRGTLVGVPRLVALLRRFELKASFFFSLGPDHTGRAVMRALRPGFVRKVKRSSVLSHYGLKTLLYGTLLPGPDIGKSCAGIMKSVAEAGHEVGIHCWDHVKWQDGVEGADQAWTEAQMERACKRFLEIFGNPARAHAAAGWQMNPHALRLTQRLGCAYSSDSRGARPFMPICNGELVACAQLPTTLPTLDEIIGANGVTAENAHESLLAATAKPQTQVYTLHAELEGQKLEAVFERLLEGWLAQGYQPCTLQELHASLDLNTLPRHEVVRGSVPGRSGTLMLQGDEFLATA